MGKYDINDEVQDHDPDHTLHHRELAFGVNDLDIRAEELEELVSDGRLSVESLDEAYTPIPPEAPTWGALTGDISEQTDLATALAARILSERTITNPSTEKIASWTVQDDGSSTDGWLDRVRIVFVPASGESRPTFWLNEYGETRGMPAKNSTVAARFFAALNAAGYTARSETIPIFEISDFRDGVRSTIFGIYKGGRVTLTRLEVNETRTTPATAPWINENLNYVVDTSNIDHVRILVQGVAKFWMNEWGAIRGTSPYSWGDALVRAIRDNGDGITSGNALELVDRRTGHPSTAMFGVRWADGRIVQGDQLVGAVFTLEAVQGPGDIPATLPAGTLIVRKVA